MSESNIHIEVTAYGGTEIRGCIIHMAALARRLHIDVGRSITLHSQQSWNERFAPDGRTEVEHRYQPVQ